jgi:hypothetical protein
VQESRTYFDEPFQCQSTSGAVRGTATRRMVAEQSLHLIRRILQAPAAGATCRYEDLGQFRRDGRLPGLTDAYFAINIYFSGVGWGRALAIAR